MNRKTLNSYLDNTIIGASVSIVALGLLHGWEYHLNKDGDSIFGGGGSSDYREVVKGGAKTQANSDFAIRPAQVFGVDNPGFLVTNPADKPTIQSPYRGNDTGFIASAINTDQTGGIGGTGELADSNGSVAGVGASVAAIASTSALAAAASNAGASESPAFPKSSKVATTTNEASGSSKQGARAAQAHRATSKTTASTKAGATISKSVSKTNSVVKARSTGKAHKASILQGAGWKEKSKLSGKGSSTGGKGTARSRGAAHSKMVSKTRQIKRDIKSKTKPATQKPLHQLPETVAGTYRTDKPARNRQEAATRPQTETPTIAALMTTTANVKADMAGKPPIKALDDIAKSEQKRRAERETYLKRKAAREIAEKKRVMERNAYLKRKAAREIAERKRMAERTAYLERKAERELAEKKRIAERAGWLKRKAEMQAAASKAAAEKKALDIKFCDSLKRKGEVYKNSVCVNTYGYSGRKPVTKAAKKHTVKKRAHRPVAKKPVMSQYQKNAKYCASLKNAHKNRICRIEHGYKAPIKKRIHKPVNKKPVVSQHEKNKRYCEGLKAPYKNKVCRNEFGYKAPAKKRTHSPKKTAKTQAMTKRQKDAAYCANLKAPHKNRTCRIEHGYKRPVKQRIAKKHQPKKAITKKRTQTQMQKDKAYCKNLGANAWKNSVCRNSYGFKRPASKKKKTVKKSSKNSAPILDNGYTGRKWSRVCDEAVCYYKKSRTGTQIYKENR